MSRGRGPQWVEVAAPGPGTPFWLADDREWEAPPTADPRQAQPPSQDGAGSSVLAMIVVCLLGGGILIIGLSAQVHRWAPPPVPSASAHIAGWADTGAAAPAASSQAAGAAPMSRSAPVLVQIPAIGVRARIIALGLAPGGGVGVPSLSTPFLASWYDGGPAPGQPGPAVLLGHVDSAAVGPAVFYRLGDLRPGEMVYITRRDHRTVVFRVDAVVLYPEWNFPTGMVYGPTALPTLRLITCGGDFDDTTHHYLGRTIVFAVYAGQETPPASHR